MSDSPRILVIRFSAIGDCVMAAWAVSSLRNTYPDANIVWAVEPQCAPVICRNELVQRTSHFHRNRWKSDRWSAKTWKEQVIAYGRLRNLNFDLGFDLHGHSKTALAMRLANPKKRIATFATDALAKKLNPVAPSQTGKHIVEQHLLAMNILADPQKPFLVPTLPIMPNPKPVEGIPDGEFISIMTGASSVRKSLNALELKELGSKLLNQGHKVVYVGGPKDPAITLDGAVNLVGKLGLSQSISVIAKSRIHIAADTGTGHIASSYGVPTLTIFGQAGYNPEVYRPFGSFAKILRNKEYPNLTTAQEIYDFLLENNLA